MRLTALLALAAATPSFAAERSVSVTDFDRLRVEGAFTVEVRSGPMTSARINGTQAAIEATSVAVVSRQLVVRRNRQAWGGYPGQVPAAAALVITTPQLANVWVSGPAKVIVARLKGLRVGASLEGAGALTVASIEADRTELGTLGSGTLTVAGKTGNLTVAARGSGIFDASALKAQDVKLTSESAGDVTVSATRAADVTMTGTGSVTVLGTPACTVKNTGAGTVVCGR